MTAPEATPEPTMSDKPEAGGAGMSLRCWWFGCEQHEQSAFNDPCIYCGGCVEYGDMVGDTRHNRFKEWAAYWLLRKWFPKKCSCCGGRWKHDESVDHIPF